MDTRAGIAIYGQALHYTEVERLGGRYRLLRLGSCEFEFDIAQAVGTGRTPRHLDALADALLDVFDGSVAQRLHVALHPPVCYSFFTPLALEESSEARKEHLLRDAALLTRTQAAQPFRLTADAVYTETLDGGGSVEWFHVLALDEHLHLQFDRVLRLLPQAQHRTTLSMHAVATVVERIERDGEDGGKRQDAPFTLALGWYPTHVELTLCRHSRWYFSHFTEAGPPADCDYFALALLRHVNVAPAAVGRLFIYGMYPDREAFAPLADAFGLAAEPLNPMQLFDLDAGSMAARDRLEMYAPCLGTAL